MRARRLILVITVLLVFASVISPAFAKDLVNMEFKQAPLVDVFQILGQLGGYNVLVDPAVTGEATFSLKDLSFEEALDLVTRTTGYRYKLMGNTLVIASDQRLKTEFGTQDFSFVPVQYVDVAAAQRLVTLVVPNVKSYVDQDQNLLVIYGLTSDLDLAKSILKQYDQKSFASAPEQEAAVEVAAEPEIALSTRAVGVLYGSGSEILAQLRREWPGRDFRWDESTQSIIGETTRDEWQLVEALIYELDLPKFDLKGLLGTQEQTMALVEYKGVTTLVKQGDLLSEWEVALIAENQVEFTRGHQKVIARMGR